jgi:hypothetical protein
MLCVEWRKNTLVTKAGATPLFVCVHALHSGPACLSVRRPSGAHRAPAPHHGWFHGTVHYESRTLPASFFSGINAERRPPRFPRRQPRVRASLAWQRSGAAQAAAEQAAEHWLASRAGGACLNQWCVTPSAHSVCAQPRALAACMCVHCPSASRVACPGALASHSPLGLLARVPLLTPAPAAACRATAASCRRR